MGRLQDVPEWIFSLLNGETRLLSIPRRVLSSGRMAGGHCGRKAQNEQASSSGTATYASCSRGPDVGREVGAWMMESA